MAADAAYSKSNPPADTRSAGETGPTWPIFGQVSSGCLILIECFSERTNRPGYAVVRIENQADLSPNVANNYSGPMEEIRQGFGRTFSRLPAVFGVSRQTLYNWLEGEMPNERHQQRIIQLAEAARAFSESSFIPSAGALTRSLSRGKSFLELMSEGADGHDTAQKLVTLTRRSLASRARLDAALQGIEPAPSANLGFGAQALDEDAT
jgi:transcriptional regulator with XRE-family HTH domain